MQFLLRGKFTQYRQQIQPVSIPLTDPLRTLDFQLHANDYRMKNDVKLLNPCSMFM